MGAFEMTLDERRGYALQFVAALGEGWTLKEFEEDVIGDGSSGGYFDPLGPNGEHLVGYFNPHTGRLSLGMAGRGNIGITIHPSRGPEAAAKEYRRRMEQDVLAAIAKKNAEAEEWRQINAELDAIALRLAQIPGWKRRHGTPERLFVFDLKGATGYVEVRSTGDSKIELYGMSPEMAERVMRAVTEAAGGVA